MQNAFFMLFQFDFDRCFWADREKRPFGRSFVVEQIWNVFFLASTGIQSGALFSFHSCPSERETWPRLLC